MDLAVDSHSNQLKEKRKQNGLLQQPDKPSDRTTFRLAGNWTKVGAETGISYLNMPEENVEKLSRSILDARQNIHYCKECLTLTDDELCPICKIPSGITA